MYWSKSTTFGSEIRVKVEVNILEIVNTKVKYKYLKIELK